MQIRPNDLLVANVTRHSNLFYCKYMYHNNNKDLILSRFCLDEDHDKRK
jgi:hypothetical protein